MIKLNPEVIRWLSDITNDMQRASEASTGPHMFVDELLPWPNWERDPLIKNKAVSQFADMEGDVHEAGAVFDDVEHELYFYVAKVGHIEPEETQ